MVEKHIVTEGQLKTLCKEWQERLRLQAWDVKTGIYRERNFCGPERQGENEYNLATGTSLIRILDPADYPESKFKQDMEVTLVHELLHLVFAPFEPDDDKELEHKFMERAICQLSGVLVELKREVEHAGKTPCTDSQAVPIETGQSMLSEMGKGQ